MADKINVEKNMIRYIIPFSFQTSKNITFPIICQRIKNIKENGKEPLWVEYCIGNKECDLYDVIQKSMQCTSVGNQGIGQYYKVNTNCIQKHFSKLKAVMEDGHSIEIGIVDMGLHIFQAGIGFFWYELNINTSSIDELLVVNNAMKEIAHTNSKIEILAMEFVNNKLPINIQEVLREIPQDVDKNLYIKINGKNGGYIKKTNIESDMLIKDALSIYMREGEIWCKYKKELEFDFSLFIVEHLFVFDRVKYFASREKSYKESTISIPDKAILFSVVLAEGSAENDLLSYLYWLGKGYVDSYFVPESFHNNLDAAVYEPFQNSLWFSSLEGCAQIICKSDNEKRSTFFETTYITRLEDYFYIYILVLHQYYGLLKYDEEISELPNDMDGYRKAKDRRRLYNYKQKLNFYMMNSVFLRVSHITHHNMFFDYLKKSYEIEQITSLMLEKVNLMNEMVEQWQQKQKNKKLFSFTIIGGIFVLIQTFNNILGIYDYFELDQWISKGVFSFYTLLLSILLSVIIWVCVKDWSTE